MPQKIKLHMIMLLLGSLTFIRAQQRSIPRIELMPDKPSPYLMRDWKQVARNYDAFVFDTSRTGTYLPMATISPVKGINYPAVNPILMDSYVGSSDHGNVAEAINVMPAIIGATLVGIDKSGQLNTNWVVKLKNFFNLKNGQNVYLNDYASSTGNDWWYELMPNVFFYQLYSLYPNADADFNTQFTTIADRELAVLYKLGGKTLPWTVPSMNYRAFNLLTGLPNNTSVPEPEAAGSIAWLMYQAYTKTGQPNYLQGAELALDFLQEWTINPSYEIQLPYGIVTAARMNAVEGTNYNIDKFLNWTFSAGKNTLRGWGCLVGNWNGYDISGLIGEANDAGNDYAFCMNGFQQAGALAPVAKYDKRYAKAIGKWLLNLANASRLYYSNGLPEANQEPASHAWDQQNDTTACIPYESMKQTWNGLSPYAMGDAVKGGWAATDLSLYSGSSIGYMAAILEKTNVDGILQIDLNKTDFGTAGTYPTYLYYNPYDSAKTVVITLPSTSRDVYDAISETVLESGVKDSVRMTIPAKDVRLLVNYPAGKTAVTTGRVRRIDGTVIDYHVQYNYTNSLRIKAFSVSDTLVVQRDSISVFCLIENASTTQPTYQWFQNGTKLAETTTNKLTWKAPAQTGSYQLSCLVSDDGDTVRSNPISVTVIDQMLQKPVISAIHFSNRMPLACQSVTTLSAVLNTSPVQYAWTCSDGSLTKEQTAQPNWQAPATPGIYSVTLSVSNAMGTATRTSPVLVKSFDNTDEPVPIIYYPLNGDTYNKAQDAFHAISVNGVSATGANGLPNGALDFPSTNAYLYTPNELALNFRDHLSLSFWIKPDALPTYEQFILSHGSWEERYKVSITPEKKVRWTVKTDQAVVDVDDDTTLNIGSFYQYTAMYTGYSLELYRNGLLSGFKSLTGLMGTTSKSLTVSRKDASTSDYHFEGTVDEIRLYTTELPQYVIQALPSTFTLKRTSDSVNAFRVAPNPFTDQIQLQLPSDEAIHNTILFNAYGRKVYQTDLATRTLTVHVPDGIYFIQINTDAGNVYHAKLLRQD